MVGEISRSLANDFEVPYDCVLGFPIPGKLFFIQFCHVESDPMNGLKNIIEIEAKISRHKLPHL